jgi:hypothetical protein
MAFLKYLLGASGAEAPIQALDLADNDDEVYPVHTFDDPGRLEILVTTWTMRFNDVLDKDKIHKSLAKLLEIGDWRKAGGRLRQKVKVIVCAAYIVESNIDPKIPGTRTARNLCAT